MQSALGAPWFSGTKTSASSPFFYSSSLGPQVLKRDLSRSTIHAHLVLLIAGAAGYGIAFGLIQRSFPAYSLSLGVLDLIVVGPTLATNSLSTGLIAWKAWCALTFNPLRLSLTMSLA